MMTTKSRNADGRSAGTDDVYQAVLITPIGAVGIRVQAGRLVQVDFLYGQGEDDIEIEQALSVEDVDCVARITGEINAYFHSPDHRFRLPYTMTGTDFQKRVWNALLGIPAGEVRTYGDLAKSLGTGARAVGNACRHNPLPIVVPCHRVVGKQGPGGFSGKTAGDALGVKQWLLTHEKQNTL